MAPLTTARAAGIDLWVTVYRKAKITVRNKERITERYRPSLLFAKMANELRIKRSPNPDPIYKEMRLPE